MQFYTILLFPVLSLAAGLSADTQGAEKSTTCLAVDDNVIGRTCPKLSCTAVRSLAINTPKVFTCVKRGDSVRGNTFWGLTTDGQWYASADFYHCNNSAKLNWCK